MIKNWFVTGDTHGQVLSRLSQINAGKYAASQTALIILGDAGINFYLNKTDINLKRNIQNTGFTVYCVRGNHEERPENLPHIVYKYDQEVGNTIIFEPDFPNIRYFLDGEDYDINGYSVLVIGGAYSVDKWYRLSRMPANASWTGWFKDEQLTPEEMEAIEIEHSNKHFD